MIWRRIFIRRLCVWSHIELVFEIGLNHGIFNQQFIEHIVQCILNRITFLLLILFWISRFFRRVNWFLGFVNTLLLFFILMNLLLNLILLFNMIKHRANYAANTCVWSFHLFKNICKRLKVPLFWFIVSALCHSSINFLSRFGSSAWSPCAKTWSWPWIRFWNGFRLSCRFSLRLLCC